MSSYYRHHVFFCINQRDDGTACCADHKSQAAVAIQFRRGDYLTDPATNRTMGICGPEYYRDAVAFGVLFLVLVLRPRGLLGPAALREA